MRPNKIRQFGTLLSGRSGLLLLLVLALPLVLGAWKEVTGRTINPRFVERIKDGQTKKHEILLMFGDPEEIDRTPNGVVFIYKNYKAAEVRSHQEKSKVLDPDTSALPYFMERKFQEDLKKPGKKASNRPLASTLTIRFKPDGETVLNHEYKEF